MFDDDAPGHIHIYSGKPPQHLIAREQVNRLLDSILQLTAEINALDAKRQTLRDKLLKTCCPSA